MKQMPPIGSSIVVGMSGGVDSSVSALLLKQMGYKVIGIFMKNWEEKDANGFCTSTQDYNDVIDVCSLLDIPYYVVNFSKEYQDAVFSDFLSELKKGNTPNPDILCNREIKFKALFDTAKKIGAHALATGHYTQIEQKNNMHYLMKGQDPGKDQSYFLYTLKASLFTEVLFPIGHLKKSEVRRIAEEAKLPIATKRDSTGICFIGKRKFGSFLQSYIAYQEGPLVSIEGKQLGTHNGIAYYTIGQRKGLGIGGEGAAWFVVNKDPATNTVFVAQGEDHSALFASTLTTEVPSWITEEPLFPLHCAAKIRYRQKEDPCVVEKASDGTLFVTFEKPQRAITPQQSIVFYDGDFCLGGALIKERGPSLFEKNKLCAFAC